MSRISVIMAAVQAHIVTAIPTASISNDPNAFENLPADQYPHARITFEEDDPEILDFKQERRRASGNVTLGYLKAAGATEAASREVADLDLEEIRDLIFADPDLGALVDGVRVEAAVVYSGRSDPKIYAALEVTTEELF